jgi:UDP-N-acetylmuramoyl-tripeptide--D-alanyl-D-alanine ligase
MSNHPEPWRVTDVLEATGGRLVREGGSEPFSGISTDTRTIQEGELFVAISGESHDGHRFLEKALQGGARGLLVAENYLSEKAVPPPGPEALWIAVPDPLKALGDLAGYRRRQCAVSVVAITGTNGKTTTKEMTAGVLGQAFEVLKTPGNFNNLVGLPLTLFGLSSSHEWAVLEIAMNHPGEIRRLAQISGPDLGVITNIEAGHLEGVKDINGVTKAKGELLEVLGEDGVAILNADDDRVCRLAERFPGRIITFGVQNAAEVRGEAVSQSPSGSIFDLSWYDESVEVSLRISGMGAIYNALAAAAVGFRAGLSIEDVKKGLEGTVSLPGRMEVISLAGGIHLINDAYNANPGSVALAIETLRILKGQGRGHVVLGDMLELGEHARASHQRIGTRAARAGLAGLYATGEFADKVAEGATGAGMDPKKVFVGTREELTETLKVRMGPGDWVLVKGSRRMAMDRLVERLRSEIGCEPDGKTQNHQQV